MNIAVFSHYFTPEIGAPSARIHDMAKNWLEMGHRVQVATCFPNHPSGRLYPGYDGGLYLGEDLDGIRVHRHWTYVTPNTGFVRKTLGHLSFPLGCRLFGRGKMVPPDVIVGTSPTLFAAAAAAGAARRFHKPFVMEVRDLWPAIFVELGVIRDPQVIRLLERWEMSLYRRASRIVTVTEAFRRILIERGVPEQKVVNVTNGADVDYWTPREKPADLAEKLGLAGKFVILYIGAHGISQALGRVLDAAARLKDRADLVFLFVGDGAEKPRLRERAEREGLTHVRFHDPVDKAAVREFYALADLCLVPLRDIPLFDTFIPSKMFEIMAMGRPILGALRGEAADILEASGGAAVVPPEDAGAMAAAVVGLAGDPKETAELGLRGRTFVVDQYSRRALAARYLDVLRGAADEHWWRNR